MSSDKQTYTLIYSKNISDTLVIQVKRHDDTGMKFFAVRRKNKEGLFNKIGIFLLADEFPTFEKAIRSLPSPGLTKNFDFVTGWTLTLLATEEYVAFSASSEESKKSPAMINIAYDEISLISPSLLDVRRCLDQTMYL